MQKRDYRSKRKQKLEMHYRFEIGECCTTSKSNRIDRILFTSFFTAILLLLIIFLLRLITILFSMNRFVFFVKKKKKMGAMIL